MEASDKPVTAADLAGLREGIKRRYARYHTFNRDKYPEFDFTSNRASYQPLRDSFEEEFFDRRHIDRVTNHLHIPSLRTFAQLFADDDYVPSRKIFNTCQSYALNSALPDLKEVEPTDRTQLHRRLSARKVVVVVAVILVGILVAYLLVAPKAGGLVIQSPATGKTVPRLLHVAGRVDNADTVWLVVHPVMKDTTFYVQDPVLVAPDGSWRGLAFVGTSDHRTDGLAFEIRAFVRPGGSYQAIQDEEQYQYNVWPEVAQLASEPVTVIRGADK